MEARIRFSCEIYFKGKDMSEIKKKWEATPLLSADALEAYADVIDIECVEDADTCEDMTSEFIKA